MKRSQAGTAQGKGIIDSFKYLLGRRSGELFHDKEQPNGNESICLFSSVFFQILMRFNCNAFLEAPSRDNFRQLYILNGRLRKRHNRCDKCIIAHYLFIYS